MKTFGFVLFADAKKSGYTRVTSVHFSRCTFENVDDEETLSYRICACEESSSIALIAFLS